MQTDTYTYKKEFRNRQRNGECYRNFNIGNWFNEKVVSDSRKEKNVQKAEADRLRTEQQNKIMSMLTENYGSSASSGSKTLIIVGAVLFLTTGVVLFAIKKGKKNGKK